MIKEKQKLGTIHKQQVPIVNVMLNTKITYEREKAVKLIKKHLKDTGHTNTEHFLMPGETLAKMETDPTNQFVDMWKDHQVNSFKVPRVPNKFYQKYRMNMVNDA